VYAQGYGTVIDSGTTFSYLPTAAFRAFTAALDAALEGKGLAKGGGPDPAYPDICWRGGPERFEDAGSVFPTGALEFVGGASLRLPPHRYLFAIGRGEYCLGIFDNGAAGTLIGGIAVRNALVTVSSALQGGAPPGVWGCGRARRELRMRMDPCMLRQNSGRGWHANHSGASPPRCARARSTTWRASRWALATQTAPAWGRQWRQRMRRQRRRRQQQQQQRVSHGRQPRRRQAQRRR
jgi:hypothetical protein